MLGVFYFIYFVYICSMVSDRLKKFIFDKLYKELSHLEIIPYDNSLFFIDRKEKYWYLELENNGTLYWRFGFFSEFFLPFSIESPVYVKIISDWVEEVLNHKVSTTTNVDGTYFLKVEEVLNHKVSTTYLLRHAIHAQVEEVLNCKVSEIASVDGIIPPFIDKILDN